MMKKSILSSGKLRPKIFAAISAAAVVLLLALNLLLTYFGLHKTIFFLCHLLLLFQHLDGAI